MFRSTLILPLLVLFLVGMSVTTLAEGMGEVIRTSDNGLYMSYDTEIRNITSEYAYNEEGFPIYFTETDNLVSVNYSIEGDMLYFYLGRNPNRNDSIVRHDFHICFENEIRELRRFEQVNDGSFCSESLVHYAFTGNNAVLEEYLYDFRLPRSLDGTIPYYEWFIGQGAGGGGGCSCLFGVINVHPFTSSIETSYPVNTQDAIYIGVDYQGSGVCSGSEVQLQTRPASTWITEPIGTSSNYGSDTSDCNGASCKVTNPGDAVSYLKYLDLQQVDNNVDFIAKFICAGSTFDGRTGGLVYSSIYNDNPVISSNFTNNSNLSVGTINFYFNASDSSPHIRYIDLYINNSLNETYTTTLDYTANHNFQKSLPVGDYTMYGRVRDYWGLTGFTGNYSFSVVDAAEVEDDTWLVLFVIGLLIMATLFTIGGREE